MGTTRLTTFPDATSDHQHRTLQLLNNPEAVDEDDDFCDQDVDLRVRKPMPKLFL